MSVQALQKPLERVPSFAPETVAKQAILCQKLKAHSSALTAVLVLCDSGELARSYSACQSALCNCCVTPTGSHTTKLLQMRARRS